MGWVGSNSWTHPPFFSRHLVPQNVGNTIFVCYFLNIGSESNRNPNLRTSPKNQIRDYHAWNRIEKLMPQHWNFAPQTLKTLQKHGQLVFKPCFFAEIWVSKNPGFVPGSPPGGLYFQKWPPKKIFSDNIGQPSKLSFVDKTASFFVCFFLGPSWPGSLGRANGVQWGLNSPHRTCP